MSQRTIWILAGAGCLVALAMAFAARGLASDEEAGHYLIARYAPSHPELFLSTYGRPLVTLGFTLPAQAGFWAARVAAALLAGLTTLALVRMVEGTRWYHPAIVIPCLFLQPYYLAHSATVMTEPWAAFLVAWGILAFTERRYVRLSIIAGLLPVARQEWIVFWPVLAWILMRERRWPLIGILPIPMMLWAAVGGAVHGDPLWIVRQVEWRKYRSREVLFYVKSLAWILGTGILVPALVGLARAVRSGIASRFQGKNPERGQRVLTASAVIFLVMIPVYTFFAVWHPITFGMHRFLAGLAAPFTILAVAGLAWYSRGRRVTVWVALGGILALSVLLWNHPVHSDMTIMKRNDWFPALIASAWVVLYLFPARMRRIAPALILIGGVWFLGRGHGDTLHWRRAGVQETVAGAAEELRPRLGDRPVILKATPLLPFFLGMDPNDRRIFPEPTLRNLAAAAPGTWLFWDSHYLTTGGSAFSIHSIAEDRSWFFGKGFISRDSTSAVAVFQRSASADSSAREGLRRFAGAAVRVQAGIPRLAEKLREDPANALLARTLAHRYSMVGLDRQALLLLDRARRIDPDDPANDVMLVSILRATGDLERALGLARTVLASDPGNGIMQYHVGCLLIDTGRYEEARGHLLRAASMLPENDDAQFAAGSILLHGERWSEAEKYLRAARDLDPDHEETLLYLAEVVRRQGRFEESVALLVDLLERHPRSATGYLMMGENLLRLERGKEARRVLDRGYRLTGDPALRQLLERLEAGG